MGEQSGAGTRRMRTGRARLAVGCLVSLTALALQTAPARADLISDLLQPVTGADTTPALLSGAPWAYSSSATTLDEVAAATGADRMRRDGFTGRGVGIALVDTGVVPVAGLDSGNVVQGPDLALGRQVTTIGLDSYGHGTHMAGIIAGRDAADGTGWRGMAPDATLLNVRVGAFDGSVDVSQVIAAIDWVVQHRSDRGLAIRVLALAYGTDSTQDYRSDPLTHAVENAWRAGITVVVSGGNKGSVQHSLDSPAVDPYVVSVGASDTHGTPDTADDTVPAFSSRGSANRHVDVVAPGQSIVALRNPGSILDTAYPGARVDTRWFKGSGTSQAAAVVAGAAALLLQARPTLTPDQVKAALVSTAKPLLLSDSAARGWGSIDVAGAALAVRSVLAQTWPRSTGRGSLELARGSVHVDDGQSTLAGEEDVLGGAWRPATWAPASAAGTAWSGGAWNSGTWSGSCWCATTWAGTSWQTAGWPHVWSGSDPSLRGWSGQSWSGQSWSGQSWSGQSWSGQSWSGQSWSGQSWSGQAWPGGGDGG